MSSKEQSSYRQIVKATSIFGGVSVFSIIISILKSKFIAILLGPSGMGVAGLLTSTTDLVASITNFGLRTSAVKNIAEANSTGDTKRLDTIVTVFRKLVWGTGLIGAFLLLFSSSYLSKLTFGNSDYTFAFAFISITLLFNQISSGQLVLLQGMRKISLMARASLFGSLIGLFVSVPVYFFFKMDGIVPAIILTSISALLISYYFSSKVKISKIKLNFGNIVLEGKSMLIMGFFIGLTGILDQIIAYLTKIFISNFGDLNEVGFFNAGFSIVNAYVGMIFSAMLIDYYPRLAAVAKDTQKANSEMNKQAEIAVLILAPIIIIFLVFNKYIVLLLFSDKFLPIEKMISWAMMGVLFKAVNWAVGIIILARGDSRLYFLFYNIALIIILSTNIGGYYFWGLEGLGIAFLLSHFLLTVQGYLVAKHYYDFSFTNEFVKLFLIHFALCLITFLLFQLVHFPFKYIIGIVLFSFSFFYSYKELDKRLDVKSVIVSLKSKF